MKSSEPQGTIDHSIDAPIDLQVNGYAGFDFNGDPLSVPQISEACQQLVAGGTKRILATVITAPADQMRKRIASLAAAIEAEPSIADVIAGIHVEGPFINPESGFVGAHPPGAVTRADWDVCQQLIEAGRGKIRLWTLAPEMDPGGLVTAKLSASGIRVAAGHSDASLDELNAAIDSGLALFTHLGNGCPASLPRHDNIVQRVLSLGDRLRISFIADGHHVPLFALANYFRCLPTPNILVVSDCMSAAGLGPGTYRLGEQTVHVDHDLAAWCEDRSHYAGSATSLPAMQQIMLEQMGLDRQFVHQITTENPAQLLEPSPG